MSSRNCGLFVAVDLLAGKAPRFIYRCADGLPDTAPADDEPVRLGTADLFFTIWYQCGNADSFRDLRYYRLSGSRSDHPARIVDFGLYWKNQLRALPVAHHGRLLRRCAFSNNAIRLGAQPGPDFHARILLLRRAAVFTDERTIDRVFLAGCP